MNYIAGLLLLVTGRQDLVFALLCTLIEDILPQDFYSSTSMLAAQVETSVFVSLVTESRAFKCQGGGGALLEHMSCLGCRIDSLVMQWFSCLFANTLPWSVVLRIWDLLLLPVAISDTAREGARRLFRGSSATSPVGGGGGMAVLHRAALAILLRLEVEARACVAIEQVFALFSSNVLAMHDEHEFVAFMMNDKALMVGGNGGLMSRGGGAASLIAALSPVVLQNRRQAALQAFAPVPAVEPALSPPMSSAASPQIDSDPEQEREREPAPESELRQPEPEPELAAKVDRVAAPCIEAPHLDSGTVHEHQSPHGDNAAEELRQPSPFESDSDASSGGPCSKDELRASVAGLSESERFAALERVLGAAAGQGDDVLLSAVMELLNERVAAGT